jgi:hypothetical protein
MTEAKPSSSGLTLVDSADKVVSTTTLWNDSMADERERIVARFSEGARTSVPLETLCHFLNRIDRKLIIEVQVDRRLDRREERGSMDYEPPSTRIYLLHANGTLETLERRRHLRQNNRSRPRT